MTHDELLAKLANIAHNKDAHEARNDYLLALRAVVELHKPKVKLGTPNDLLCEECAKQCTGNGHLFYPCPTIQQIIENLK